jgi:hypothetical protein
MTELDEMWIELHDLERRVGRVEAAVLRRSIARSLRAEATQDRRARWRWIVPSVIAVGEGAFNVLKALGVL